ncbi:ArsR/SmtB family transcription factor [Streptomyces sp. NPDC001678]|uniref:ArsR/SmtB family transcription factor n=1 Tax=Streptomyces sp. NPDC001678 TaxID=3364599 RepID=UPI0036928482
MTDSSERHDPGSEAAAAVLDAKGLRAMAHPVRVRLVGLLRKHGPSTATRLAERLGVNSGTASYHLRQLGAAGFVEEDTERGNARERWWRSVHHSTWFNVSELVDQEPEAALTYVRSVAATYTHRAQHAVNELATMPRSWRDVFDMSDWTLRLTPEEAAALNEELRAVITRYRQDAPEGATEPPEGAGRVSVIMHVLPDPGEPASAEPRTGAPAPEAAGPDAS